MAHLPALAAWIGLAAVLIYLATRGTHRYPSSNASGHLPRSWLSSEYRVPLRFYGKGCTEEFERYFDGRSLVKVKNVDDICDFLLTCQYVRDIDFDKVPDRWKHPTYFESIRRGDCEDYALWAWRKLVELKLPAEFMVGRWRQENGEGTHAWVVYSDPRLGRALFEPVARDRARMIRRLEEAAPAYRPFASVDGDFKRRLYLGLSLWAGGVADHRKRRRQKAGGR